MNDSESSQTIEVKGEAKAQGKGRKNATKLSGGFMNERDRKQTSTAVPLTYTDTQGEMNKLLGFDGGKQEGSGESRPAATAATDEAGECFMSRVAAE